ncbi:hypothetical protein FQN50_001277 [Emmonsiellopsis sp. PD_5]|nr:hypothetical protein FQN50_001277 [Emmonsiellopsis sp. PD_5]
MATEAETCGSGGGSGGKTANGVEEQDEDEVEAEKHEQDRRQDGEVMLWWRRAPVLDMKVDREPLPTLRIPQPTLLAFPSLSSAQRGDWNGGRALLLASQYPPSEPLDGAGVGRPLTSLESHAVDTQVYLVLATAGSHLDSQVMASWATNGNSFGNVGTPLGPAALGFLLHVEMRSMLPSSMSWFITSL